MPQYDVITKTGKIYLLYNNFPGHEGTSKFKYMALGTGTNIPTEDDIGLTSECTPSAHVNYSRVPVNCTFYPEISKVVVEGIFDETNIANTSDIEITEIGLTDSQIRGEGNFFCISQIPPIKKNGETSIKITLSIIVE